MYISTSTNTSTSHCDPHSAIQPSPSSKTITASRPKRNKRPTNCSHTLGQTCNHHIATPSIPLRLARTLCLAFNLYVIHLLNIFLKLNSTNQIYKLKITDTEKVSEQQKTSNINKPDSLPALLRHRFLPKIYLTPTPKTISLT